MPSISRAWPWRCRTWRCRPWPGGRAGPGARDRTIIRSRASASRTGSPGAPPVRSLRRRPSGARPRPRWPRSPPRRCPPPSGRREGPPGGRRARRRRRRQATGGRRRDARGRGTARPAPSRAVPGHELGFLDPWPAAANLHGQAPLGEQACRIDQHVVALLRPEIGHGDHQHIVRRDSELGPDLPADLLAPPDQGRRPGEVDTVDHHPGPVTASARGRAS